MWKFEQKNGKMMALIVPHDSSSDDGLVQEQDLIHQFRYQYLVEPGDVGEDGPRAAEAICQSCQVWIKLPSSWRPLYIGGIFVGLCWCHSRRLCHRDSTRPANPFIVVSAGPQRQTKVNGRLFIRWRVVRKFNYEASNYEAWTPRSSSASERAEQPWTPWRCLVEDRMMMYLVLPKGLRPTLTITWVIYGLKGPSVLYGPSYSGFEMQLIYKPKSRPVTVVFGKKPYWLVVYQCLHLHLNHAANVIYGQGWGKVINLL